eukprot:365099-Chlamydomonas_euryale.AAC.12
MLSGAIWCRNEETQPWLVPGSCSLTPPLSSRPHAAVVRRQSLGFRFAQCRTVSTAHWDWNDLILARTDERP